MRMRTVFQVVAVAALSLAGASCADDGATGPPRGDTGGATGGGAIVDSANRNPLGARGFVIYLHTTVEQQLARTRKGRDRPLLKNDDPRAVLEALMATREPLYREIADLTVETDGRKVKAVASEILNKL